MFHEYLILLPLAFAAGAVNAAVGGGGLITVPGLFAVLPTTLPATLLGTDKLSSIFGHVSAMRQYALRLALPWRLLAIASASAFVGSYLGARAVYAFAPSMMRPLVIVLLAVMLVYTWLRPNFGTVDGGRPSTPRDRALGIALGFAIGFYDGFFGPGTGSFLVFLFVRVFRFDFLRATACAKVVNLAGDSAALVFLIPAGAVIWPLGIPMGLAAALGGLIGARLVMRGGNVWIRRLFLVLAVTLLAKLSWETLAGL
ncbi:sulfite exporter TauE/SafE family protein [Siculibacillus lacustris]|uniref:Probable membrane transporter protein n=1 Tax=Siculibacillus lacustris TaxID=1549641 RepID=A0A4Q9VXR0_9HYPH|nr:TSUP family transporter [Siculibacillus lacustris]TBW40714.1 sulfite exporter TauE/SafE family protein [Siculibacillus lacustris]